MCLGLDCAQQGTNTLPRVRAFRRGWRRGGDGDGDGDGVVAEIVAMEMGR